MEITAAMNMSNVAKDILAMDSEGMQPLDCLYFAIDAGIEYADAVYLVTRTLKLDDEQVFELEADYK
jgi:hypothetical protein